MSHIDIIQAREIVTAEDGTVQYRVSTRITRSIGIPAELFVFFTSSDNFSNVATVRDIDAWPVGKTAALEQGRDFYRLDAVTITASDAVTAGRAGTDHTRRLRLVLRAWDKLETSFPSTVVFSLDSETP